MSAEKPPARKEALTDEAIALIGGYTIVKKLGEGGAGKVFACRDEGLGRLVAIKTLHARTARDPLQRERFLREARAMARVTSSHVVGIHQVGENKGGPYIIMEYLAGTDLETRLKKGPLPPDEAIDIIRQVAQGLADADRAGIVHRDVKPANIIVTEGKAKLTDFGLARPLEIDAHVTTEGTFTGTAAFLAPERARGEPDDRRGDIYALGCTLYSLVAGEPPFVRATPIEVIGAHLHEDAIALDKVARGCPRPLALVVEKMMSKDPLARPQTYAALDAELARARSSSSANVSESAPADEAYQAQPTGVMGSLKQMGVIELAQMLELQKKTAIIAVHPRDEPIAELALEDGVLVAATFGALTGQEAFIELTTKKDGLFRIQYERTTSEKNLSTPLSFLILEALRRADEKERDPPTSAPEERAPSSSSSSSSSGAKAPKSRRPAARVESPLAAAPPPVEERQPDEPSSVVVDAPTRISPLRDRPRAARLLDAPTPSSNTDDSGGVPAYLSPLDDETMRVALSSDDPFGARDTAIVDRPEQRLEERSIEDDDESLLDRTAEHPAPVRGLSLEDKTDAATHPLPSLSGPVRVTHTGDDRTLLSPVLFDDDAPSKGTLEIATRVMSKGVLGARALAQRAEHALPRVVAFAQTRQGTFSILGALLTISFVVVIAVVTASPGDVETRDLREDIARDPAAALVEIARALERDDLEEPTRAELELLRAEAFIARADVPSALSAARAGMKGATSPRVIEFATALLGDPTHGDAAGALLFEWKSPRVDDALLIAVDKAPYVPRNEAWRLLNERGQATRVDREALYIKNLDDAPTCRERRVALLSLVETGAKSELARRAVLAAADRGRDNVCMERELATLVPKR